jgi:hypothetical protein
MAIVAPSFRVNCAKKLGVAATEVIEPSDFAKAFFGADCNRLDWFCQHTCIFDLKGYPSVFWGKSQVFIQTIQTIHGKKFFKFTFGQFFYTYIELNYK